MARANPDGPVLVIGDLAGQLASSLLAARPALALLGRPRIDFAALEAIPPALDAVGPSLVINSAAYTAVDRAETEPEAAMRANRDGPAALAGWCGAAGVPMIHVSTDYVFDGLKGAPYVETDPPSPTGVYGATKLAGEQAVLAACPQAVVLRTSWVYAAAGHNFVLTMLKLGARGGPLRVVADQRGCPTAAPDLADAILRIADRIGGAGWEDRYRGIFHATGEGETTWYGLAVAVFEEAARHGMAPPVVEPIATAEWPTPVRRPPDSRLDCTRLDATFGFRLPPWRQSLSAVVERFFYTPSASPGR